MPPPRSLCHGPAMRRRNGRRPCRNKGLTPRSPAPHPAGMLSHATQCLTVIIPEARGTASAIPRCASNAAGGRGALPRLHQHHRGTPVRRAARTAARLRRSPRVERTGGCPDTHRVAGHGPARGGARVHDSAALHEGDRSPRGPVRDVRRCRGRHTAARAERHADRRRMGPRATNPDTRAGTRGFHAGRERPVDRFRSTHRSRSRVRGRSPHVW